MRRFILAIIGFCTLVSSCGSPYEYAQLEKLASQGRQYSNNDFVLLGAPNLNTIAILYFGNSFPRDSNLEQKIYCDGYCLRLLYSGSAKKVIMGRLKKPLFNILDAKSIIQKPIKISNDYLQKSRAFTLENRTICPEAAYNEADEFHERETRHEIWDYSIEMQTAKKIISGNCLIETDADIEEADSVLEISYQTKSLVEDKNFYKIDTIRFFAKVTQNEFKTIFQKNRINTFYDCRMCRELSGMGGSVRNINKINDSRTMPEIISNDIGVKLDNFQAEDTDLKYTAKILVSSGRRLSPVERVLLSNYFSGLKSRIMLDNQDQEIILKVIKSPELSKSIGDLSLFLSPENLDTVFLGKVIFEEFQISLDNLSKAKVPDHTDEDSEFYILKNKLTDLANVSEKLPKEAFINNKDEFLKILKNSSKDSSHNILLHMLHFLPYQDAIPYLKDLANEKSEIKKAIMYRNFCFYGDEAKEFEAQLIKDFKNANHDDIYENQTYISAIVSMHSEDKIKNFSLNEGQQNILSSAIANRNESATLCH